VAEQRDAVAIFEDRVGTLVRGGWRELTRIDITVQRLPLLADAAVVVDAQIPRDADQPRLEVGAAVERVERLEQLQEDVLRQILGEVVTADELVRDVEDLAPVEADDLLPRSLIAVQATLDDLVDRDGLVVENVAMITWRVRVPAISADRSRARV
jgi:hypothetical protein